MGSFTRGFVWTTLTAAFAIFAGPMGCEMAHNNRAENKTGASVDKIVQASVWTADPTAATPLQTAEISDKLTAILSTAGGDVPTWKEPMALRRDGLKRIANKMPGFVRFTEKIVGEIDDVYHQGYYQTSFDLTQHNLENIAKMKIGICFDKNLSALNAGSLYYPAEGMIVLNPTLSEETLAKHVQRHLDRLDQEVVKPYERLTMDTPSAKGSYGDFAGQVKSLDQVLSGTNVVVLDTEADPQVAAFRTIPAEGYQPPLIKLKDKKPAETAPVKQEKPPVVKIPSKKK